MIDKENFITYAIASYEVKEAGLDLHLSNWGIASRIDKDIVLNRALLKYRTLCLSIIEHEIKHSGEFTLKDMLMDLSVRQKGLFLFCLKHPKTLSQFIPIGYRNGYLWLDYTMLLLFLLLGASIWVLTTFR